MSPAQQPSVASLPMYDLVELRAAHDALWDAVVGAHGQGLPASLTHDDDVHALWHSPTMAVSQACGWPLVDELDGRVRLVGAFAVDVSSAEGAARYRSHLLVRAGDELPDPATATAAVNSFASLSGWLSLVRAFPALDGDWPGGVIVTGAHVASLAALQDRSADVAAVDAVTHAHVARHRPHLLDGLAIVGAGPLIPCLPLIANIRATDEDVARLQEAFTAGVARLSADQRDALLITGFHPLTLDDYAPVRSMRSVWQGGRS
jgi:ABC-type phosphate/phosphonate transport system substrate-binding protein